MSWTINERCDVERQVVWNLCREIVRGTWSPGESLPAPSALAQEQILNPRTVEAAFSWLAQTGLLYVGADGDFLVSQDAVALARDRLLTLAGKEVGDLVNRLKSAGLEAEDIRQIWKEVTDD